MARHRLPIFSQRPAPRLGEFVTLTAPIISLVALSIDAMLPALQQIGGDLGVRRANDSQLIIPALFLGLATGQMFFGPLSDSVGRKPAIYTGLVLFISGCLLSILATSFPVMLAPGVGQVILMIAYWRAIFGLLLAVAAIALVWFGLRQPETLAPERRVSFSPSRIVLAVRETCVHRVALGYTIASGLIFGASVVNARLVMRHGMRPLSGWALTVLSGISLAFLAAAYAAAGAPPLWALMAYMAVAFFCIGILFGNFNALAMEPLGHIAGVGAAVVGSLTTLISLSLGALIGQSYDGTVLPLVGGFALLGIAAIAVMRWTERGG